MNTPTRLLIAASLTALSTTESIAQPFNNIYGLQFNETARGMTATRDGGYVTVGSTDMPSVGPAGTTDILVVKYFADGTVQWAVKYGGVGNDIGYSVKATRDGGYIVAAETESVGTLLNLALVKLDGGGGLQWSWVYEGDTSAEDGVHGLGAGVGVVELLEGFVLVGRKRVTQIQQDGVMVRTGPGGNPMFNFRYRHPAQEVGSFLTFSDVRASTSGELWISGTERFTQTTGASQLDPLLVRLTANGGPIAATNFTFASPGAAAENGSGDGLDLLSNGDIALNGRTDLGVSGTQNLHVMRIDPGFVVRWMQVHRRAGTAYRSIHEDRAQNIVSAGWRGTFPTGSNAMGLSLDPLGSPVLGKTYQSMNTALGMVPNPFNPVPGYGLCGVISPPAGGGFGANDINLIHTDSNGDVGCLDDRFEPTPERIPLTNPRWIPAATPLAGTIWQADYRRITLREDALCTPSFCPPCAADFNLDGGVDGADVVAFFQEWSAGQPCADVNLDGGVDGADVNAFFQVWSSGGC